MMFGGTACGENDNKRQTNCIADSEIFTLPIYKI